MAQQPAQREYGGRTRGQQQQAPEQVGRSAVTTPSTIPRIGVISGAMIMAPITVAVESLTTAAVAITPDSSRPFAGRALQQAGPPRR